jgi:ATP-dependent Clp protease ATP-binding subunit ClpC
VIQKYIEDPLSEEVVRGRFKEGGIVEVRHSGEELTFSLKKDMVESALNDRV